MVVGRVFRVSTLNLTRRSLLERTDGAQFRGRREQFSEPAFSPSWARWGKRPRSGAGFDEEGARER